MTTLKQNLFASALLAGVTTAVFPSIQVDLDGVDTTLYVQYPDWAHAETSGSYLSFDYNNRMYLSWDDTFDTSAYFMPSLVGGSIEYDVDISQQSCGCVTALYTITMPEEANKEDPFKYCDANYVGGYGCPEFDIMEANQYAWHTTGHTCDWDGTSFSNCDKSGQCTKDVYHEAPIGSYGPNSITGIDTTRPFHYKHEFHETNGQFSGYTATFTQDGRSVVMEESDCDYLNGMTSDMSKMVIAISNWSSDEGLDEWLQFDSCEGTCQTENNLSVISNMKFVSGGATPVSPELNPNPAITDLYWFGNDCATKTDDACATVNGCQQCAWSWPMADIEKWESSDAMCRCKVDANGTVDPQDDDDSEPSGEYTYGDACSSNVDEDCALVSGCNSCNWSWPSSDPAQWSSSDAKCRCMDSGSNDDSTPVVDDYTYGDACSSTVDEDCALVSGCNSCNWSWPSSDPAQWSSSDAKCRCMDSGSNDDSTPVVDDDYVFGSDCATLTDEDCALVSNCLQCSWSWPSNDPAQWSSSDAKCRCALFDESEPVPEPEPVIEYTYGNDCKSLANDDCALVDGCLQCSWSWPSEDPLRWASNDAKCRCQRAEDPTPIDDETAIYRYGNECTENQDTTLCDDNCENCHMSWLVDDTFLSSSAACRCMPQQRASKGYQYGNVQCEDNTQGLCNGEADCRWSWPIDSEDRWDSAEALCRPKVEEITYEYNGDCGSLYDGECGADCHSCKWSWPLEDTAKWNSANAACRCENNQIKEVIYAEECLNAYDGLCGTHCNECRFSWEATDSRDGETSNCRCKNW